MVTNYTQYEVRNVQTYKNRQYYMIDDLRYATFFVAAFLRMAIFFRAINECR